MRSLNQKWKNVFNIFYDYFFLILTTSNINDLGSFMSDKKDVTGICLNAIGIDMMIWNNLYIHYLIFRLYSQLMVQLVI